MRSSIGVTKVLACYFIFLHLFLKAKMCVGTVHGAASGNINDSEFNGDESFLPVGTHTTVATLLDPTPSPAGHSVAKIHRRQHAVVSTPKLTVLHHVRHERSHVKNRHIVQPQEHRSHKSNFKSAEASRNWYPIHRRTPHHRQGLHQRDFNPTALSTRNALRTKLIRGDSRGIESVIYHNATHNKLQVARRPSPAFSNEIISSSVIKHGMTSDSKTSNLGRRSKNYFEDLLNSYKSYSPYYKDHLQKDSSKLTKSLQVLKTKCSDKKCKNKHTKEENNDDEYDYEYDEEDDDDDDEEENDDEYYDTETQGDAGYSTTANSVTYEADGAKHFQEQDYTQVNTKFDNSLHQDNFDAVNDKVTSISLSNSVENSKEVKKLLSKEVYATDANMAKFHVAKLRREGNCFIPKPKIVLASNDPTKQYTPHCTILHRCGDDVGCCPQAKTCAASKNSTVELYFFVKAVGSRSTIERLSFINHTECACINRLESSNRRTSAVPVEVSSVKPPICNCPTYFQRVVDNDNHCFCDCSSSDSQCDQFKRGLEHFSMDNRRCIINGRCEEPRCEYGHYNVAKGKCPVKKDALRITYKG